MKRAGAVWLSLLLILGQRSMNFCGIDNFYYLYA